MIHGTEMKSLCEEVGDAVESSVSKIDGARADEVVGTGADGTPTKYIDRTAEDAALDVLEEYGDLRVISEEVGEVVYGDPEFTVVLDPVDGTYNASVGIPLYTVSVCIADGRTTEDAEYGYVRELKCDECFTARRGEGAYLNGERIEMSDDTDLHRMSVGIYNTSRIDVSSFKRLRVLGSASLEMSYAAADRLDAFMDLRSKLRVVDFAASKLIVEEAGGVVTDSDGDEIEMRLRPDECSDLVAATPGVHSEIVDEVTDG
ncbi:bifunctional fructose-bisphosphatase/inositol-phosphate phosphatase [Halorutilales archaeon Cl-col2-1]